MGILQLLVRLLRAFSLSFTFSHGGAQLLFFLCSIPKNEMRIANGCGCPVGQTRRARNLRLGRARLLWSAWC